MFLFEFFFLFEFIYLTAKDVAILLILVGIDTLLSIQPVSVSVVQHYCGVAVSALKWNWIKWMLMLKQVLLHFWCFDLRFMWHVSHNKKHLLYDTDMLGIDRCIPMSYWYRYQCPDTVSIPSIEYRIRSFIATTLFTKQLVALITRYHMTRTANHNRSNHRYSSQWITIPNLRRTEGSLWRG